MLCVSPVFTAEVTVADVEDFALAAVFVVPASVFVVAVVFAVPADVFTAAFVFVTPVDVFTVAVVLVTPADGFVPVWGFVSVVFVPVSPEGFVDGSEGVAGVVSAGFRASALCSASVRSATART